jgi:hypothetical protein
MSAIRSVHRNPTGSVLDVIVTDRPSGQLDSAVAVAANCASVRYGFLGRKRKPALSTATAKRSPNANNVCAHVKEGFVF